MFIPLYFNNLQRSLLPDRLPLLLDGMRDQHNRVIISPVHLPESLNVDPGASSCARIIMQDRYPSGEAEKRQSSSAPSQRSSYPCPRPGCQKQYSANHRCKARHNPRPCRARKRRCQDVKRHRCPQPKESPSCHDGGQYFYPANHRPGSRSRPIQAAANSDKKGSYHKNRGSARFFYVD